MNNYLKDTTDAPVINFNQSIYTLDNEYNILTGTLELVRSWARKSSLFMLVFGTACCAIEMLSAGAATYDFNERSGILPRATPKQADLIIIAGTVTYKMVPVVKRLYGMMPEPKWVISLGSCANSGGPFHDSYNVLPGIDKLLPVDVYVPGCPPRPEALMHGVCLLQEKIMKQGTEAFKSAWGIK
ncbi:MAG: NADH-quinone oxidoreductase subunit B family protein [bacterium]